MSSRYCAVVLSILILLFGAVTQVVELRRLERSPERSQPAQFGTMAPEVAARDEVGENIDFSGDLNNIFVVEFGASWCPPCQVARPVIRRCVNRWNEGRTTSGKIILIEVLVGEGDIKKTGTKEESRIVPDPDRKVSNAWGIDLLPTLFVVHKGTIKYRALGFNSSICEDISATAGDLIASRHLN